MARTNLDHVVERRAELLADAIGYRIDLLAGFLAPKGRGPVFTERLRTRDAAAFWLRHRYDDIGRKVLAQWDPEQVMELDRALSEWIGQAGATT